MYELGSRPGYTSAQAAPVRSSTPAPARNDVNDLEVWARLGTRRDVRPTQGRPPWRSCSSRWDRRRDYRRNGEGRLGQLRDCRGTTRGKARALTRTTGVAEGAHEAGDSRR